MQYDIYDLISGKDILRKLTLKHMIKKGNVEWFLKENNLITLIIPF